MSTKKERSIYHPTDAETASARNRASVQLGDAITKRLKRHVAIEPNGDALVMHLSIKDARDLAALIDREDTK